MGTRRRSRLHVGDIVYGTSATTGDASYVGYQAGSSTSTRGCREVRSCRRRATTTADRRTATASRIWIFRPARQRRDRGALLQLRLRSRPLHRARHRVRVPGHHAPRGAAVLGRSGSLDDEPAVEDRGLPSLAVRSGAEHGSDLEVRAAFTPLFERYGVALALSATITATAIDSDSPEHGFDRQLRHLVLTGGGGAALYPLPRTAGQPSAPRATR